MEDMINSLFNRIEIRIIDCPDWLENVEVQYEDDNLLLLGIVQDKKLIVETIDDIPDNTVIQWGCGHWVINQ